MAYSIVGYKNLDFKAQDGNQIKGMQLFLLQEIDPRNGEGMEFVLQTTGRYNNKKPIFVNADVLQRSGFKPKIGANVEVSFDMDGKITHIRLA